MTKEDKQEIERRCRIAFEGFNDGGAKCYTEEYYQSTFRPQWIDEHVWPEYHKELIND